MSAHIKLRKAFHVADGSYAEVVVQIHNVDPEPGQRIVDDIMAEAEATVSRYQTLVTDAVRKETEDRAARVAALIRQNDPDAKVVSYGSAELHNEPPPAPSKSVEKRIKLQKGGHLA